MSKTMAIALTQQRDWWEVITRREGKETLEVRQVFSFKEANRIASDLAREAGASMFFHHDNGTSFVFINPLYITNISLYQEGTGAWSVLTSFRYDFLEVGEHWYAGPFVMLNEALAFVNGLSQGKEARKPAHWYKLMNQEE